MSNHGVLLKRKLKKQGRGAGWVASSKSTTGYYGVDYHKASKKFRARVMVLKKRYELGMFETAEEANAAVLRAKEWLSENPHEKFATEYEV